MVHPIRPMFAFLIFVSLAITPLLADAQAPTCDADRLLVTETMNSHSIDAIRLSVLSLMTKEQFNEMKKGGSTGGSFLVDAIPIKAYASWEDFRRAVTREKRLFQYDLDESRIRGLSRLYLSPTGAEAYVKCVELVTRTLPGTHVWAQEVSPDSSTIIVHVRWVPTPSEPSETRQIASQINGGKTTKPFPQVWRKNETIPFIFTRDVKNDFVVAMTIAGTEGVIALPAFPILKRVETEAVRSPTITTASGGSGYSKYESHKATCLEKEGDWIFNPDSAEIVPQRVNAGPTRLGAKIYVRDEPRICWEISASTPARELRVSIEAGVSVIRRRTLPD